MAQLNSTQMAQCTAEMAAFSPKIVGIGSDGAIDVFASSNPTQGEMSGAIAIMQKYITAPETAYVRVDETSSAPTISNADQVALKWEEIKAHRDFLIFNGAKVGAHWIHTDTYSRTQWLGMLVQISLGQTVTGTWTTKAGAVITRDNALVMAVLASVAAMDEAAFNNARSHKAALELSQTPSTYDYSTGWPATYIP